MGASFSHSLGAEMATRWQRIAKTKSFGSWIHGQENESNCLLTAIKIFAIQGWFGSATQTLFYLLVSSYFENMFDPF